MENLEKANALYRAGDFQEALTLYEDIALKPEWVALVQANIEFCRKKLQKHRAKSETGSPGDNLPKIVVTIATTYSNLSHLPDVIKSLSNQTLKPFRIDLNIAWQYNLPNQEITPDDPILKQLIKLHSLRINWFGAKNLHRRICHYVKDYFSRKEAEDEIFVTIDGSKIYPDYFLQRLHENYLRHNCIIAFSGQHIELDFQKILSCKQWTQGQNKPSLNNFPVSNDGVLYSTKFFTKDFLNQIPVQCIGPAMDDVWIKWHCALNGVPSVIIDPETCTSDFKNSSGLHNEKNLIIQNLEEYFSKVYGYNLAWLIQSEQKVRQ
jgi:hypothetical protein